jgi:acyl-CoA reductase-like NAD-dependent aldehyde dehydrogenase
MSLKVINPATNELIKEIPTDTVETLKHKHESMKRGLLCWKKTSVRDRILIMSKFSDLLRQNSERLAIILSEEMGKPLAESLGEIKAAAVKTQFFLQESEKYLRKEKVNHDGSTEEYISYDPLGVIANISAWNYPYLVGVNIFVPALICGNAVFYKPSEYSTLTGIEIEKLLYKAGFPPEVFKLAIGNHKVGQALLELPLDGYFFTGSHKTGKHIATTVAPKLVPVALELGGKDPLYVTDQVISLKETAEAAVSGAFYNNGQSCCSVERIYVHQGVYDDFVEHFLTAVSNLKVGNPMEKGVTQGAISRFDHLNYLLDQVNDATSKGAEVKIGGKIMDGPGNFFEPTVLTNVTHEMKVMKDETFGPIIGIQKVANDEEAVLLMNDTDYGLTASVYTSKRNRGEDLIEQIDAGTCYLNCCDRVSAYTPWSGRKNSGLGMTLSFHGIYTFIKPKAWHLRQLN